jgi:hypothetical protein
LDVVLVSEDLVEATWKKVAALEGKAALAIQKGCGKSQPELTGFFIGWMHDLPEEAAGLGLYVMVVVFEMFRATGAKLRKATEKSVMEHWRRSAELAARLEATGVEPCNLSAASFSTEEPYVSQYVIDALTDEADDEPVNLTPQEFWHLFATLMTLVDTLHDMSAKSSSRA